ncbi:MAG: class I SAM-dependent methyltransferase [Bdellovibrionales bacterium]
MLTANQKTLYAYESESQAYIRKTPDHVTGSAKEWIDEALSGLHETAHIFEIGSGNGRDADYIESLGFDIECSDAAQSFVSTLLAKGFNARIHNAILDPIIGSYDFIFANAVLPHFTHEEATLVTSKVLIALKPRGRFAFSLMKGEGERWCSQEMGAPVCYYYWTRQQVEALLRTTGFRKWSITEDTTDFLEENVWLRVIAYK